MVSRFCWTELRSTGPPGAWRFQPERALTKWKHLRRDGKRGALLCGLVNPVGKRRSKYRCFKSKNASRDLRLCKERILRPAICPKFNPGKPRAAYGVGVPLAAQWAQFQ